MTKRAAVINDLSSFGKCSLTAYIAVLSAMGVQPCPMPTAVLSSQTEFEHYYAKDLSDAMPRYIEAWRKNKEHFDSICTGYFANAVQLDHALDFIRSFKTNNCMVLVDPVMGDGGSLYPAFDAATCQKMRLLAKEADVITPNLTELCLLAKADYQALTTKRGVSLLGSVVAVAKKFSEGCGVIVTGIPDGRDICNLVVENKSARVIRRPKIGGRFSGTGDIFSAVVSGCLLKDKTLTESAQIAANFVSACVLDTVKTLHRPMYGVELEKNLNLLWKVK